MKPIIKWNFWQRRWSIFWWCVAIFVFIGLNLIFYPSIRDQAAQLNESLNQLPDAARSLFSDTADLLSPVGYLSSQVFYLMLPMLLGILTIGLGSSLLAKEENEGTIELLLARSLSRGSLLLGKIFAGLAILLAVGTIALVTTVGFSWGVDINVGLINIALASVMAMTMGLLFGAVAFYLTALGRWGRPASIGIAAAVAIGSYLVTSLVPLAQWLNWPAKFLPYHYYHPGDVLAGKFSAGNFLLLLSASLILGVLSWIAFRRRDTGA